jgi:aspartokinase
MGGSVLTGVKAFRRVAVFLKHRSEATPSEELVVVVSAQKFATDRLERQARGDPHENPRTLHIPALSFEDATYKAEEGCELVERWALLAAAEARLPLLIRSVDERAPVTVISSRSKSGSVDRHDELVSAQA